MKARFILSLLAALALVFGAASPALAAPDLGDISTTTDCMRCML